MVAVLPGLVGRVGRCFLLGSWMIYEMAGFGGANEAVIWPRLACAIDRNQLRFYPWTLLCRLDHENYVM